MCVVYGYDSHYNETYRFIYIFSETENTNDITQDKNDLSWWIIPGTLNLED